MGEITERTFRCGMSDAQLAEDIDNAASGECELKFVPNLSYVVVSASGHKVRDAKRLKLMVGGAGGAVASAQEIVTIHESSRPRDLDKNEPFVQIRDPRKGLVTEIQIRKAELAGGALNTVAQLFDNVVNGHVFAVMLDADDKPIMRGQFNPWAD